MTLVPKITLHDGTTIPQLAFGTWQVPDADVTPAVLHALETGYRHIDTAAIYGNEAGVGRAIAQGGVAREDLYVTTKLWNDAHQKADARRAIETSLEKLGLDHVDLYLIHWPSTVKYGDAYIEAWDALQEFKAEGLATSIGVSNFHVHHLDALRADRGGDDGQALGQGLLQKACLELPVFAVGFQQDARGGGEEAQHQNNRVQAAFFSGALLCHHHFLSE